MFHTDLYNCTKKRCDSLAPGQAREVLYSSLPVCACVTAISPLFFPWRKPIELEADTRSIRSATVRHTAISARPEGRHGSGSAASLVVVGAGRSALAHAALLHRTCRARRYVLLLDRRREAACRPAAATNETGRHTGRDGRRARARRVPAWARGRGANAPPSIRAGRHATCHATALVRWMMGRCRSSAAVLC